MNSTHSGRKLGFLSWTTAVAVLGASAVGACTDREFKGLEEPAADGGGGAPGASGGSGSGGSPMQGSGASGGTGFVDDGDAGREPTSTGDGGDGGPEGDAGPPPPEPECRRDEDCVLLTCGSSAPTCLKGQCVPGTCDNVDPDHCDVTCERVGGRAACTTRGKDSDGDGEEDARCLDAAGTDCDDTRASVYQGATEVCDGLDNDCDQKIDLNDGLALGGTATQVTEAKPGILAMVATSDGFALLRTVRALMPTVSQENYLHRLDAAGNVVLTASRLGTAMGDPLLARVGGELFIQDLPNSDPAKARLMRLPVAFTADTVPTADVAVGSAGASAITPQSSQKSVVVHVKQAVSASDSEFLNWFSVGGTSPSSGTLATIASPGHLYRPAIAAGATGYGAIWSNSPTGPNQDRSLDVKVAVLDQSLFPIPGSTIDTLNVKYDKFYTSTARHEMLRPQIVAAGEDYVAGWYGSKNVLTFARLSKTGTKLCTLPALDDSIGWGLVNTMASDGKGVYIVFVNSQKQPAIAYMNESCQITARGPLSTNPVALGSGLVNSAVPVFDVGQPVIARKSDGALGVAWIEATMENDKGTTAPYERDFLTTRVLGSLLCN